jgi:hypothetical protein
VGVNIALVKILGLVLPFLVIAAVWRPKDGVTRATYYIAPAIALVIGIVGVLQADAANTPDVWIGLSASLAGIALAGLVLVIEGFLPLSWWTRAEQSPDPAA